jgi:hypothetical protein
MRHRDKVCQLSFVFRAPLHQAKQHHRNVILQPVLFSILVATLNDSSVLVAGVVAFYSYYLPCIHLQHFFAVKIMV